jgi:dGTPase
MSNNRIAASAQKLEDIECKKLAPFALKSRERRDLLGDRFRVGTSPRLEYRTEYHRDRDRIIWSKAFKRLQHKTQVFPHYVEDHYKRRLTHSLEVAQIATTVARGLNLNEIATEAIALGHDLGHTPFGHAGEKAINNILNGLFKDSSKTLDSEVMKQIKRKKKTNTSKLIPIFGFDHCVHAIEVVSRIEKEYGSETNFGGLNLTYDVRDGILKHICERKLAKDRKIRPFSNIPDIVKYAEYNIFGINKGSLEAQCVYFADKVTYLLGDLEDGIRSNIFQDQKLNKHDFIKRDLSKYYKVYRKGKLEFLNKDNFTLFRSKILSILILNCIDNAKENIKKNNIKNVDDVLSNNRRMVFLSEDLKNSWKDFYSTWMEKVLFKHHDVVACSVKAEKIVTDLFNAYFENPGLINSRYFEHCHMVYEKTGISDKTLLKIIIARNYIAGMTDVYASNQHARLYMSLENIRF